MSCMAAKTANVTARIQPEIKQQAEAILDQLGIPVSVLIDSLYRQIILTNSIPYPFRIPTLPTREGMTPAQFDAQMAEGLRQAKAEQGLALKEAFEKIREDL